MYHNCVGADYDDGIGQEKCKAQELTFTENLLRHKPHSALTEILNRTDLFDFRRHCIKGGNIDLHCNIFSVNPGVCSAFNSFHSYKIDTG